MAAFSSAQELSDVFGGFLAALAASDDDALGGIGIAVGFVTTDPAARFVIDAREAPQPGKRFAYYVNDASAPATDVEFTAGADTLDKLFKGEAQVMMLAMTGKVKVQGDMGKAMGLMPALAAIVPPYRAYRGV